MKFDPNCKHNWIVTRWNTQEKYHVAELLACQTCCRIKSWQDVVHENHVHDAFYELWLCVKLYKPDAGIDPDAFRGLFMKHIESGDTIPITVSRLKAQYDLYPVIDPEIDEE